MVFDANRSFALLPLLRRHREENGVDGVQNHVDVVIHALQPFIVHEVLLRGNGVLRRDRTRNLTALQKLPLNRARFAHLLSIPPRHDRLRALVHAPEPRELGGDQCLNRHHRRVVRHIGLVHVHLLLLVVPRPVRILLLQKEVHAFQNERCILRHSEDAKTLHKLAHEVNVLLLEEQRKVLAEEQVLVRQLLNLQAQLAPLRKREYDVRDLESKDDDGKTR